MKHEGVDSIRIPTVPRPERATTRNPSKHPYANTNVPASIVARELARGELVADDFGYWIEPKHRRGAILPIEMPVEVDGTSANKRKRAA